MDTNIKIIEGVKEFPCLRNNSGNFDERNQSWSQLAEKLELHEQFLKIRWHTLLQGYQRDANFKYAKWMYFMCRNTERKNNKENWPEFIITEEYLKDDNTEDQEQFVLLDTDEEEDNNKPKERECTLQETSKQIQNIPKKELTNEDQAKPGTEKEIEVVDVPSKSDETSELKLLQHHPSSPDVEIISSPNPKKGFVSIVTASNVQEKITAVDVNKDDKTSSQNEREILYEKSLPVIVERGEDVIFGELVSAMLKRMEENKKKNIKREIMNILFS